MREFLKEEGEVMVQSIYELAAAGNSTVGGFNVNFPVPESEGSVRITLPNPAMPWFARFPKESAPFHFQLRGAASGQRLYVYVAPKGEAPWHRLPDYSPESLMCAMRAHHNEKWRPTCLVDLERGYFSSIP